MFYCVAPISGSYTPDSEETRPVRLGGDFSLITPRIILVVFSHSATAVEPCYIRTKADIRLDAPTLGRVEVISTKLSYASSHSITAGVSMVD